MAKQPTAEPNTYGIVDASESKHLASSATLVVLGQEGGTGHDEHTVRLFVDVAGSQNELETAAHDCSVPIPAGLVFCTSQLSLLGDSGSVPFQARTLSNWQDGSIQWVRVSWLARLQASEYALQISRKEEHSQRFVGQARPAVSERSSQMKHESNRVPLDGILLEPSIVLEDGERLEWRVEEHDVIDEGPINRLSLLRGRAVDHSQRTRLYWEAQVQVTPCCKTQRWKLTLRNSKRACHPGGIWELGDANALLLRSAELRIIADTSELQDIRNAHARVHSSEGWRTCHSRWELTQLSSGTTRQNGAIHRRRDDNSSPPYHGYRLRLDDELIEGRRATPSLILQANGAQAFGIQVSKFWQVFPKKLKWEQDAFILSIFPEESGHAHEIQPGEQTTIEFTMATGSLNDLKSRLGSNAMKIRVDPEWICRANVIPWLTPKSNSMCPKYLSLVGQATEGEETFFQKRERIDEYGWRHFGDVWGDHEAVHSDPDDPLVSHYNNQYDMILGLGLNYLRGGDEKWLELMQDLARHVIDIDIYHTDDDLPCYNHGMFWHTVHYVDAGLSTHRTYPKGTCGGGPSSGHAYARGLMLYYCMTGDVAAREAVVKMGEWMIAAEDGSATKYRWLARGETGLTTASGTEDYHGPGRGPGNAVEVLVTAFELTHERRFLDQAEKIIRRVVHPDQDIAALDLLDAENKWFYNLFLQALGRYLEVKLSMRELDRMYAYSQRTLLRFADWMADHEYPYLDKPEKLEFPTETWAAQEMRKVEVFQWAARHATGEQRQRFLERAAVFFKTSCNQLESFADKKSLCRPMALLLTNGYSHDWFMQGGLEQIEPAPLGQDFDFGEPTRFVSQKVRAIRRAKLIVAVGALASLVVCAFVLGYVYL